jgi:hypothetical protein
VVATTASAFLLTRPGQRTLTSLDAVTLTKASRCCADALTSASPDGVLGLHATPDSFRLNQSPLAATPGSRSVLFADPHRCWSLASRHRSLPGLQTFLTTPSLARPALVYRLPLLLRSSRTSQPPTIQRWDPKLTDFPLQPLRSESEGPIRASSRYCGVATLRPPWCAGYPCVLRFTVRQPCRRPVRSSPSLPPRCA